MGSAAPPGMQHARVIQMADAEVMEGGTEGFVSELRACAEAKGIQL